MLRYKNSLLERILLEKGITKSFPKWLLRPWVPINVLTCFYRNRCAN